MKSRTSRFLGALVLFGALTLPLDAWAAGRVHGTVFDQSGAVIPGAVVVVVDTATGKARTLVTDASGAFAAEALPDGRYDILVSASGFAQLTRSNIALNDASDEMVNFTLSLATRSVMVDVTATVTGDSEQLARQSPRTNDTASVLDGIPGVSLAANGSVSGIPALHGLADDRVKLTVNGMTIASACSGHMNPPLSYVDPANLGSIKVMAGITPVSYGGDSIAGTVVVDPARPAFSAAGLAMHASATAFTRTNGDSTGGNATFSVATDNLRISYIGSYASADNYAAGGGAEVKSTFYTTANHALQVAVSDGRQTLTGDVNVQRIPEQGFANARMDMTRNDALVGSLRYESTYSWGHLDARGYGERTDHQMNILRDKVPGMNMPMNTKGSNVGYSLVVDRRFSERDLVRVGTDLHRFHLDDWWPPVMTMVGSMGPDTLQNVNNGRRTRVGTYGEWESRRGAWTTMAGLRSDIVSMNTDDVTGYNMSTTATGSAAYYTDAVEFNARERARRDYNVDATLLARTAPTETTSLEFGYARKTRSPNLYERYLWVKRSMMSVQMNGWFGDGNGYFGNLDLAPEVAHTVSATAGWRSTGTRESALTVTPYFTRVNDYIDADRCAVIAGSNGCTAAKLTATTGFVDLQFANHDARLYGLDMNGRAALGTSDSAGKFALNGVVSYVRGRILDTGDNTYRLMPLDARLTLEHSLKAWTNAFTVQGVATKKNVQAARNELATPGYTLLNFRSGYQFNLFRVDVGIDNLTDRKYTLPLGGRYWIGDTTGATGVPGIGRSLYLGVTAKI